MLVLPPGILRDSGLPLPEQSATLPQSAHWDPKMLVIKPCKTFQPETALKILVRFLSTREISNVPTRNTEVTILQMGGPVTLTTMGCARAPTSRKSLMNLMQSPEVQLLLDPDIECCCCVWTDFSIGG